MDPGLLDRLLTADAGSVGATRVLSGETGRVWRIEADGETYAVKITDAAKESAFASESPDARVYSARWSNLVPAYEHLAAIGAPAPTLFAAGAIVAKRQRFQILEWLDGDADDFSEPWFAEAAKAMGRLHASRRPFQGWVAMRRPYPVAWSEAFGASWWSWRARSGVPDSLQRDLERRAPPDLEMLADPTDFVFSHTDGLQGVFRKADGGWRFLGVVDIEDHQFTDQRFVLAGFELGHAFSERAVPDSFWPAYAAATPLAADYRRFRPLFQSYLLLVWSYVFRDRPAERARCLELLAGLWA